ncbi:hypothetical protein FMUND_15132 [Fusarium mundagurra]|uniref:Uncharacterized protein n=1 Tax=Fusarium mundagurra TaxID=1567541 RepID=A0A8H6CZZ9_9HYPO|nr:hypothetical protein FMUND_15132 [Fusarium mundagurra]
MGDVSGIAPDFFARDKLRMGWLNDEAVDCVSERGTTEHTLTPLELKTSEKDIKVVVIAVNQTSALVAEARIPEGIDSGVCAPGVLLYTVDTSVKAGYGPLSVLDATPGPSGCGTGSAYYKNDGTLSLVPAGVSSYQVPGWGVKVTVVKQTEKSYTIQVKAEI